MKKFLSYAVLLALAAAQTSCTVERQAHLKGNTIEWTRKNVVPVEHAVTTAPMVTTASFELTTMPRTDAPIAAGPGLTAEVKETSGSSVPKQMKMLPRRVLNNIQHQPVTIEKAPSSTSAAPQEGEQGKMNTMALLGFIFSFFFPLLGLIFSLIGLNQIKTSGERGHGLAVAGIIISAITLVIIIALVV